MKLLVLKKEEISNIKDIERFYIMTTFRDLSESIYETLEKDDFNYITLSTNEGKVVLGLLEFIDEDSRDIYFLSYDNINFNHMKYLLSKLEITENKIFLSFEMAIMRFYDKLAELNDIDNERFVLTPEFLESIKDFELTEVDEINEPVLEIAKINRRISMIDATISELINAKYPEHKQRNAALGMYGEEYKTEMLAFIEEIVNKGKVLKADSEGLYIDL